MGVGGRRGVQIPVCRPPAKTADTRLSGSAVVVVSDHMLAIAMAGWLSLLSKVFSLLVCVAAHLSGGAGIISDEVNFIDRR